MKILGGKMVPEKANTNFCKHKQKMAPAALDFSFRNSQGPPYLDFYRTQKCRRVLTWYPYDKDGDTALTLARNGEITKILQKSIIKEILSAAEADNSEKLVDFVALCFHCCLLYMYEGRHE